MALAPGTRLGSYDVISAIGAGGEVYRARDTKLARDVAIKILPEEFAEDEERLARFEREAKLLASLNHPNIASIYGFEHGALVLEFVDGPTLAERIAEGPIPFDEAVAIARQIAEALEAGHETGVIHRDLKPANIKLKENGSVKVLDYGLAKALESEATSRTNSELAESPTLTRKTEVGIILGTAAYMSPEQVKGKRLDKRTDIFSFGAVLYEMLAGRKAFAGHDVSDTLAAVLRAEPDWDALPGDLSPTLRAYLIRCLDKAPGTRVRDIGDVRLALSGAFDTVAEKSAEARTMGPWWAWGIAALAALGVVVFALSRSPSPRALPTARFTIPVRGELPARVGTLMALSPGGDELVYVAVTDEGDQLYRRSMNRLDSVPIPGTKGGRGPFFSPDGQTIGFTGAD